MDPFLHSCSKAIASRYLHSWFVFDVGLVAIDIAAGFMMLLEEAGVPNKILPK